MRTTRFMFILLMGFILSACATSLIVGNAQSKLMWAMLKPLVGFDPNEVNLFEQPMIKNRMVKLLGSHYDTTMRLLNTANEIQQEGALFYVISRYTPIPGIAKRTVEKAGFVWNADTNQMAVMLVTDGAPQVIAEQIEKAKAAVIPSWPLELQQIIASAEQKKKALEDAAVQKTTEIIGETLGLEGDQPLLEQVIESTLKGESASDTIEENLHDRGEKIIEDSTAPLRNEIEKVTEPIVPPEHIEQSIESIMDATDKVEEMIEKPVKKSMEESVEEDTEIEEHP